MNSAEASMKIFDFTKSLVSVINIEAKTVSVFSNDGDSVYTYEEFPDVVASFYGLVPNFKPKLVRFLENLDPEKDSFELPVEYNTIKGNVLNLVYLGIKNSENEFVLGIKISDVDKSNDRDELTKAFTRRHIIERSNANISSKTPFSLLIVDIDYFKQFNDVYGHMFGDVILVEVVAACKAIIGDRGSIARIGGDEFLIILDIEDDYDIVHSICSQIKESIGQVSPSAMKEVNITATIGSATYPLDGDSFELLFRKADKALYRGKKKGRDCFIMYTEEKCGVVTLDEDLEVKTKEIDSAHSTTVTAYPAITGVIEILNRNSNIEENFKEALNLIGSYFCLDRVGLIRNEVSSDIIENLLVWHNPSTKVHYDYAVSQNNVDLWREEMGEKKYLKVSNYAVTEGFRLNHEFVADHTIATLAFEMIIDDKAYGLFRVDMTTSRRKWQPEDIQIYSLLSKIFAIHLNRNYVKNLHYKDLYFDKLTGCYNYNKFYLEASQKVLDDRCQYAIMEFFINDYRKLRDIIGKKKFDDMIIGICEGLKSQDGIIFGRKTENCFNVMMPYHDKKRIENLHKLIKDSAVASLKSKTPIVLSVWAGVYLSDNPIEFAHAVELATLTSIERNRKTELMFYNEEIYQNTRFKTELILHLEEALKNDEFMLYLQPKFNSNSGKVVGAEALTRWNYKFERILYPDTFIPLLEEKGQIQNLDYKVFENVCKFQKKESEAGRTLIPISVNVSRYVSDFNSYLNKINAIRKKYEVPAKYIEIEITEGMYYSNSDEISDFIDSLHKDGYRVSMDDFGSGYSNFTSLAKLNFDTIKLDKSFCEDLNSERERIMVHKIMDLVNSLNMEALCEGVETKENVEYLKSVGCYVIQGYYYSKPIPANDFEEKYLK